MIFQQPIHAVRLAALFIGGERQDDIPVGDESLLFHANEARDGNRIAVLHVLCSAAIVVAVLLDELEGIGAPVLAPRFHHIQVPDDEDGLALRSRLTAIAGDHVALAIIRTEHGNVRRRKSCIQQALFHCLSRQRGTSDRIRGVDFDQLLEDIVGHGPCCLLALCGGPGGLQAQHTENGG